MIKPPPFNEYEATIRVITRMSKEEQVPETDIRKLVESNPVHADKLADGLRIEKLNNRFPNVKLCPTCGGSVR